MADPAVTLVFVFIVALAAGWALGDHFRRGWRAATIRDLRADVRDRDAEILTLVADLATMTTSRDAASAAAKESATSLASATARIGDLEQAGRAGRDAGATLRHRLAMFVELADASREMIESPCTPA